MALWSKKADFKTGKNMTCGRLQPPHQNQNPMPHSKKKRKKQWLTLQAANQKQLTHSKSTNDTNSSWEVFFIYLFLLNHNQKCKVVNSKVSSLWHHRCRTTYRQTSNREIGAYPRTGGWGWNLYCNPDCVEFCCAAGSLEQHSPAGHLYWVCSKLCWPTHGLESQSENPLQREHRTRV